MSRTEQMVAAEVLAESILAASAKHEVAMNDHAVGLMQALRSVPTTDATGIENALNNVAHAIRDLAQAVREQRPGV